MLFEKAGCQGHTVIATFADEIKLMAQALVSHSERKTDWLLIGLAIICPVFFLCMDLTLNRQDLFQRSGALTNIFAVIVASKSLNRHYMKIFNASKLKTSKTQIILDRFSILLLIAGTLIWAYGDLLTSRFVHTTCPPGT